MDQKQKEQLIAFVCVFIGLSIGIFLGCLRQNLLAVPEELIELDLLLIRLLSVALSCAILGLSGYAFLLVLPFNWKHNAPTQVQVVGMVMSAMVFFLGIAGLISAFSA